MIFTASVRPLEFLEARVEAYKSPASTQEYHWVWVELKGGRICLGRICLHARSSQTAIVLAAAINDAMRAPAENPEPETTDLDAARAV